MPRLVYVDVYDEVCLDGARIGVVREDGDAFLFESDDNTVSEAFSSYDDARDRALAFGAEKAGRPR